MRATDASIRTTTTSVSSIRRAAAFNKNPI
jgi:hypothetical protein